MPTHSGTSDVILGGLPQFRLLRARYAGDDGQEPEYASFLVQVWDHMQVTEVLNFMRQHFGDPCPNYSVFTANLSSSGWMAVVEQTFRVHNRVRSEWNSDTFQYMGTPFDDHYEVILDVKDYVAIHMKLLWDDHFSQYYL